MNNDKYILTPEEAAFVDRVAISIVQTIVAANENVAEANMPTYAKQAYRMADELLEVRRERAWRTEPKKGSK